MCDCDELVPADAKARKFRPVRDAMRAGRGGGVCRECPRHDAARAWCPVLAKAASGREPMCRYGESLKKDR